MPQKLAVLDFVARPRKVFSDFVNLTEIVRRQIRPD